MNKIKYLCTAMVFALGTLLVACQHMLVEEPRTQLVPTYFKTGQGIESGVNALYSNLRGYAGPYTNGGTDEMVTNPGAQNANETALDFYNTILSPANSPGSWGFNVINTANGIIEFGETATSITDQIRTVRLAEARWFRAMWYFRLVKDFGPVPLDLGSGKLRFNDKPSTTSERDPIADVYDAIIADLEIAVRDLPTIPTQEGRATKRVALHVLAKVYLTRAYSSAKQPGDFAKAFQYADELIANQGIYGVALMQDYRMIHAQENDDDSKNPEVLLRIQYGRYNDPYGGTTTNATVVTPGYENCLVAGVRIVDRSIKYQRPWRMCIPTPYVTSVAFSERKYDARFDNSFRMMWECNNDNQALKDLGINVGDPGILLYFDDEEKQGYNPNIVFYKVSDLYRANGTYREMEVNNMYPNLVKFDDIGNRITRDDFSYRPHILFRLGETYLIAAEALIGDGKPDQALNYIKTIRERAAYRPELSPSELAEAKAKVMEGLDASKMTIEFILEERTRELYGETPRWHDLVRTNTLVDRIKRYNPNGGPNIQPWHILRPIPQTQIDLMTDPAQREKYQNPGYTN